MLKIKLLIAFLVLYSFNVSIAQQDSSNTNDEWDWHWKWNESSDWKDFKYWNFDFDNTHPAISLQYGLSSINRHDIQSKFLNPNLIELKLGYIKERDFENSDYIIDHRYKYIYLSNESNKLAGKEAIGSEIAADMWRFGFGRLHGYGYKVGENSAIIPYYSYTLNWSNIDFKYPENQSLINNDDIEKLNLYDKSFRFGTSSEGGVRFKLIENLILDAGYERSVVFQRHLFWKWAGSGLLEAAAQGLLDGFINKIFKSSPAAGPVVNFLLKNALAYGIYELRKDKMNWPFKSEAPITYDQFKFGVTFVF
ncbi:MAG: hypothetical protein B6D44_01325 [Ignavibacteriales bacterium UTCHB2]|jgi:hypothetical protein|nr:MAG: hypothetical protein BWY38_00775 [Ignavibacteria bacterium ADurb.Bin266]OQY75469.1 MAG: hypothetical protein B6D44_01325 [Ignavibacteriales bacterium UTCHB2]HQI39678.1 hypothetical protein [Ignavibacteriaceae bacterium]HQJ45481.1 hypothetical protein [Ignavibacteriaceae bacterium]